jgi:hypothetical protein
MAESTIVEAMYILPGSGVTVLARLLRGPNEEDTPHVTAQYEAGGFSGMLGCINCMHWF